MSQDNRTPQQRVLDMLDGAIIRVDIAMKNYEQQMRSADGSKFTDRTWRALDEACQRLHDAHRLAAK